MIRINIKNLSADIEIETVQRVEGQHYTGDLQGLFDKVSGLFASATRPFEEPSAAMAPGEISREDAFESLGVKTPQPQGKPTTELPERAVSIEFLGKRLFIGFTGSGMYLPIVKAFEFTGFKNVHHVLEAVPAEEQVRLRMAAEPEGKVRSVSCVTEKGLDLAWREATRLMRKRQVKDDELGRMEILFADLKRIFVDAGVQVQRELLGIPGEAGDSMYPTEDELAGLFNKTELLQALVTHDTAWTKERMDRLLVDQGILRADALTWGKRDLTKVTLTAVREEFIKVLPVRGARKAEPGQVASDAHHQHWKPYFTKKTVDYILFGPQGDTPGWGMIRVQALEGSGPTACAPEVSHPNDSDNK